MGFPGEEIVTKAVETLSSSLMKKWMPQKQEEAVFGLGEISHLESSGNSQS